MSTTKEALDDAELAKSYITNSGLSDDYKRTYLRLINISTLATNGISVDEKIQKMTECIQLLAVTQGMYLANIDQKIDTAIYRANRKQCQECKAMAHAIDVEQEKHDRQILEQYKEQLGLNNKAAAALTEKTWSDVFKEVLSKPYIYAIGCLLAISPYGVEIIKTIFELLAK